MLEGVFWRNYFHHCDETRDTYLKEILSRKNQHLPNCVIALRTQPPKASSETFSVLSDEDMEELHDDSSLVPASVTDDSSYVMYPSPDSGNSFTTTRSWDDIVFVGRDSLEFDKGEYLNEVNLEVSKVGQCREYHS
jgi:hypothetical protein